MLEAEIAMSIASEHEESLVSVMQGHRERWEALSRIDRLERELRRVRRQWDLAAATRSS